MGLENDASSMASFSRSANGTANFAKGCALRWLAFAESQPHNADSVFVPIALR